MFSPSLSGKQYEYAKIGGCIEVIIHAGICSIIKATKNSLKVLQMLYLQSTYKVIQEDLWQSWWQKTTNILKGIT